MEAAARRQRAGGGGRGRTRGWWPTTAAGTAHRDCSCELRAKGVAGQALGCFQLTAALAFSIGIAAVRAHQGWWGRYSLNIASSSQHEANSTCARSLTAAVGIINRDCSCKGRSLACPTEQQQQQRKVVAIRCAGFQSGTRRRPPPAPSLRLPACPLSSPPLPPPPAPSSLPPTLHPEQTDARWLAAQWRRPEQVITSTSPLTCSYHAASRGVKRLGGPARVTQDFSDRGKRELWVARHGAPDAWG